MSKTFITGDHHFFHTNVIKFCDRPFSDVNDMNKTMIEHWNEKVQPEDNVIHVGDFFCGFKVTGYLWVLHQLNGKIYLIRGNHDKKSDNFYKSRFGFVDVEDFTIINNGKIFICHYPLVFHPYQKPHERERIKLLKEAYDLSGCQYVFHGHSHNSPIKDYPKNHYNVGVDLHDFYPIDLKEKINELNWK
jgi:calcineurin-like phosphoesterase family protein